MTVFRYAISSAVNTASKSSSLGGLFGRLAGDKTMSSPPLDVPLEDVFLPPPLPDFVQQGQTKVTTLRNGLKIASETSPVCNIVFSLVSSLLYYAMLVKLKSLGWIGPRDMYWLVYRLWLSL